MWKLRTCTFCAVPTKSYISVYLHTCACVLSYYGPNFYGYQLFPLNLRPLTPSSSDRPVVCMIDCPEALPWQRLIKRFSACNTLGCVESADMSTCVPITCTLCSRLEILLSPSMSATFSGLWAFGRSWKINFVEINKHDSYILYNQMGCDNRCCNNPARTHSLILAGNIYTRIIRFKFVVILDIYLCFILYIFHTKSSIWFYYVVFCK